MSNVKLKWLAKVGFMLAFFLSAFAHASDQALFKSLTKLANDGNARAQYNVGMMLNNGMGTKQNLQKAFYWFSKAAEAGDVLAAYKVGCFYGGQFANFKIDIDKSLQNKLIAANAGYSLAQHDVGVLYFGQGQFDKALSFWQQAADQGYPQALYNLSVANHEGKLVAKDATLAYAYFKLAKLKSEGALSSNAQSALDALKSTMSAADAEKAEQFVSTWQAKPSLITLRAEAGIAEARDLADAGK